MKYLTNEYEILTSAGFKNFDGIYISNHDSYIQIIFEDGQIFKCSLNHLILKNDEFIEAKNILVNDIINNKKVIKTEIINENIELYDPLNVEDTHHYLSSGITSHNCAFVKPNLAEDFLGSVYPTITSDPESKIIQSSTPFGYNHFAKTWFDALNGENEYKPIFANWTAVPGRDEKFKKETIANVGPRIWRQDFLCDFLGSDLTLIDSKVLATLTHRKPIFTSKDNCMNIYKHPIKDHIYCFSFDSSEGKESDYHALNVIDITNFPYEQCLVYRNNTKSVHQFAKTIWDISEMYKDIANEIIIVGENNQLGQIVLEDLAIDLEFDGLIYHDKGEYGVRSSTKSKKIGCSILKSLVEEQKLLLIDYQTINEAFRFVDRGGKFKADEGVGSTDDIMMSLVIFSYLTSTKWYSMFTDGKFKQNMLGLKKEMTEDDLPLFGFIENANNDYEKNVFET